jgi:hypothetical protein
VTLATKRQTPSVALYEKPAQEAAALHFCLHSLTLPTCILPGSAAASRAMLVYCTACSRQLHAFCSSHPSLPTIPTRVSTLNLILNLWSWIQNSEFQCRLERTSRGFGWRIHCGVEVTESSTNEEHTLSRHTHGWGYTHAFQPAKQTEYETDTGTTYARVIHSVV